MSWYEMFGWTSNEKIVDIMIYKKPVEELKKFLQDNPGFDLNIEVGTSPRLLLSRAQSANLAGHVAVLLQKGADPSLLFLRGFSYTCLVRALNVIDLHVIALYFFHEKKYLPEAASFSDMGNRQDKKEWLDVSRIYASAQKYYAAIEDAKAAKMNGDPLSAIDCYQLAIDELLLQRQDACEKFYIKNIERRHDILFEHYSEKILSLQKAILVCLEETFKIPRETECNYKQYLEAAQRYINYTLEAKLFHELESNTLTASALLTEAEQKLSHLEPEQKLSHFSQLGQWYKQLGEQQNSEQYLRFAAQSFYQAYDLNPSSADLLEEVKGLYRRLKTEAVNQDKFEHAKAYDRMLESLPNERVPPPSLSI